MNNIFIAVYVWTVQYIETKQLAQYELFKINNARYFTIYNNIFGEHGRKSLQ